MATVGIIANPAAGKDIRRLVAQGRFIPNQEKVNVLKRILSGLDGAGVEKVLFMPDSAMLGKAALHRARFDFDAQFLEMPVFNEEQDSSRAAELMAGIGVDCLVTLGGDGTNRAVAKNSGDIPLLPVSTGTNNVFPTMAEGTVAGLGAGVVANGLVDIQKATVATDRLDVYHRGQLRDIALIDVAVSKERFVGARAIWNMDSVHEIFLARAQPGSIGISAIGAQLNPMSTGGNGGIYALLGPGGVTVRAPVSPGAIVPVEIQQWRPLRIGESVELSLFPCTVALDGERSFTLSADDTAHVSLSCRGPRVVDVDSVLREAALNGVFVDRAMSRISLQQDPASG